MNKFAVGALAVSVLTLLGVGCSVAYENHQTSKKVGKSVEELKNATIHEISESLLKEAVANAADIVVSKYIRDDNDAIMSKAQTRLGNEIHTLVSDRYNEVTKEVSERMAKHVAQIDDPDRLKKAVRSRAEDILVSRFEDDLNDLKARAEEAFDDANDRYSEKLDEAVERFEEKLDNKVEGYADNLSSMKKVYEAFESVLTGHKNKESGKEIRFTLG